MLNLAAVAVALALAGGHPFVKGGEITQEKYAEAIEKNDTSVLNLTADRLVAGWNIWNPANQFSTPKELADYIRTLKVGLCHQGILTVAYVVDGKVSSRGEERAIREGEMCLFDGDEMVLSLSCGNFIGHRASAPARPVAALPPPIFSGATASATSSLTFPGQIEVNINKPPSKFPWKPIAFTVGTATAAAAVLCTWVIDCKPEHTTEVRVHIER